MQENNRRIEYVDGLKGILCIMVFLCHFVYAFYFALYSAEYSNMHNSIEPYLAVTAFNLIYNGKAAARVFLIISGYLIANKYFSGRGKGFFKEAAVRYIRLTIPIILVELISFFMLKNNMFYNIEASVVSKSEWLAYFYNFDADITELLKECIYGCLIFGSNRYLGVLWIMKYEFIGSIIIYILVKHFKDKSYRYLAYGLVMLLSCVIDKELGYLTIIAGMLLYDINNTSCFRLIKALLVKAAGLAVSFLLLSYPPAGINLENTFYRYLGTPRVVIFYILGSVIFFYLLSNSKNLQAVFNMKVLKKIGKYSEGIYFTHFIVIAGFSSRFLIRYAGALNYNLLMLINFVITSTLVMAASVLLTKILELLKCKKQIVCTNHLI